jgi:hypothetical protein
MSDSPLSDCPVCLGELRRIVNSVGIVFKGSGFYVTDNRNGSTASANGAGSGAAPKKEKEEKGEKKSEDSGSEATNKTKSKESAPSAT